MIGTILGDLAASKYENGKADLSPLGKMAMGTALQVIEYSNAVIVPSVNKFSPHQDSLTHRENAVKVCQAAWNAGKVSFGGSPAETLFYDDKAGMYFYWIMSSVLDGLIHGRSKREALGTDGGKYLAGAALDDMIPEKYRPDLARIFSYQFANRHFFPYMAGGNVIGRFRFEEGLFDTWRVIDVQEVNHDGMMDYTLPEGLVSMEKLLKYICKTAQ